LSYALRSLPLRYVIFGIGVYSIDILGSTSIAVPLEAWFTEHLSWHWIFWQSAFITPLMMICIYFAIPHPPKTPGPKPTISWRGFLYGSLGLSLIYGALDQGERLDWLNSGVIVGLIAAGIFLLLAALIRRWFSPNPMLNPIFLANRNTLILAASLFSFRFVLLSIAFLLPAVLGVTQQYRPLETGRVLLWLVVPLVLMGWTAAQLMRRFDNRLVLASGFTLVAIACLMNAQLTSAWAGDNFFISQILTGFGLALAFTGLVGSFVQNAFDSGALSSPINVLTYSAFIHTVRLFGGETGTTIMQRLVAVREQYHSNMIGLHVDSGNWLVSDQTRMLIGGLSPGSPGPEDAQGRAALLLGGQVKLQAFTLAYSDGYTTIAFVAALVIVLIAMMNPMKIYFDATAADATK
jgi:DHA2 family multidrug resistance protein